MPLPGVVIGDCGPKVGLVILYNIQSIYTLKNGIDNGFLIFKSYRIPAENLLNKLATVDEKGNFVPTIKNPDKRFALSLGALSGGRLSLALATLVEIKKLIN